MADPFDPYHVWLGIPPEEQPPNHYRLLGIKLFEDNPDVIAHAADQRMTHLRSFQAGAHSADSQRLLNQVAAARVCLLNEKKKAAYDRQLRTASQAAAAQRPAAPPPARAPVPPPAPTLGAPRTPGRGRAAGAPAAGTELAELGDYQLLEKLGQGGMGTVYKALHLRLGREVALKVLATGRLADERAIARFEREMQAVGRLSHPNIVQALDAREIEGTRFLVMELLDGMDLEQVLRHAGPLPVADACEVVRQAALGLQCAHAAGLVHRDVKPSNLMLTATGQVKLLDLGLARFQSEQAAGPMTSTGHALGTLDYMAPEQAEDTHQADIRADIYSLGCTLFKLLAGRAPFAEPAYETPLQKLKAHCRIPPPPIRQVRGDVPKEVAAILQRMLAKDPRRRYQEPAEVADALGPFAAAAQLPALLARARSSPPLARPDQALKRTQGSFSAGLTRFFQGLSPAHRAPAGKHAQPAGSKGRLGALLGAAGAAAVLLLAVVIWALSRGGSEETMLVFDLPAEVRAESTLRIDGQQVVFPAGVRIGEYECAPGEHRVEFRRPGYEPWQQTFHLEAGQQLRVEPVWQRQPCLVLNWPPAERAGAKLWVDGQLQDLDKLAGLRTVQLRIPLQPGSHQVRISRPGYTEFAETVQIPQNQELALRPAWVAAAPSPGQIAGTEPGTSEIQPGSETASPPQPGSTTEPGTTAPPGTGETVPPQPAETTEPGQQQPEPGTEPGSETPPAAPAGLSAEQLAALEAVRRQEAQWAEATGGVEAKIAQWDFAGALGVLDKLEPSDPALRERLRRRRDEVRRMAEMKRRIIEYLNAADPHPKALDLGIKVLTAELTGADESGVTVVRRVGSNVNTRQVAWSEIGPDAPAKLLERVVDRQNAEDWLSAACLAQACGLDELAGRLLAQARSMGADITPFELSQAAATLSRAIATIDTAQGQLATREPAQLRQARRGFAEAESLFSSLERRQAEAAWPAGWQAALSGGLELARRGPREADAEELYAQATELLEKEELFDLRDLVNKLKAEYADTSPVTDAARSPSFAELEEAVAQLGQRLVVRQDGKGDFTSIQAAIDAAAANSVIEIADSGTYFEIVTIAKDGLTIRGRGENWPMIAAGGPLPHVSCLVTSPRPGATLEHLIVGPSGGIVDAAIRLDRCCLRKVVVLSTQDANTGRSSTAEHCLFATARASMLNADGGTKLRNCTLVNMGLRVVGPGCEAADCLMRASVDIAYPSQFVRCILTGRVRVASSAVTIRDCIINEVQGAQPVVLTFCNLYGAAPLVDAARAGQGCLQAPPGFVNSKNFDFRLLPGSACIGKASDGGDIGVRWTPEMLEMLKLALELRARGVIKF